MLPSIARSIDIQHLSWIMSPDMLSGRAVAVSDTAHAPVLCRCSRFEATRPARFPLFSRQPTFSVREVIMRSCRVLLPVLMTVLIYAMTSHAAPLDSFKGVSGTLDIGSGTGDIPVMRSHRRKLHGLQSRRTHHRRPDAASEVRVHPGGRRQGANS
jgi:hypothetical protein